MHSQHSFQARVDALTATLLLEPRLASRNRNFALHATDEGARARQRAARIRSLVRQLGGGFGPVRGVQLEPEGAGGLLEYALSRCHVTRTARLTRADLALVRVLLGNAGLHLLPKVLVASDDDRELVATLLAGGAESLGLSRR